MLEMIEGLAEKRQAQSQFVALMQTCWPASERRCVVWRPGKAELPINHNSRYWFGHKHIAPEGGASRYWNLFGLYSENGNLHISVEINIQTRGNGGRVAGFFAIDPAGSGIYLMHDGALGGGRAGVGRDAFLEAARLVPVPVQTASGRRFGVIVAQLKRRSLEAGIRNYLDKVVAFKRAVAEGGLPSSSPAVGPSYGDYYREFSGAKGGGGKRFIYESRHGDVVDALANSLMQSTTSRVLQKSVLIDLAVSRKGQTTDVYEVKCGTDRQSIYTGIGQLMVHTASGRGVRRHLVLPAGSIARDISKCLANLAINVLRYEIDGHSVSFSGAGYRHP